MTCLLMGLVGAGGYLQFAPRLHTATAAVNVNVISSDPFNASRSAAGLIDPGGEAQVAGSYAVAERAAAELGPEFTAERVRGATTVISVADTTILRITSTSDTARDASAIADIVASEYLDFRSDQAETRIQGTIDRAESRLASLRVELAEVTARLTTADEGSPEAIQAEADRSVLSLEISSVLAEMANTSTIDTNGGTILNPASGNPVQVRPGQFLTLATGALAGLGFGLAGAFVVNAAASRVRDHRDLPVGETLVLGDLPGKYPSLPPSGHDLFQLRAARERLLSHSCFTTGSGICAVIDLTLEGRAADVAPNLAYAIASAGIKVQFVGLGLSEGFTSMMRDELRLTAVAEGSPYYNSALTADLSLYLPSAEVDPLAHEPVPAPLRSDLATRSLDSMIILAVPSTGDEATRLAALQLSDGAIFVVSRGHTRKAALRQASHDVESMGVLTLGTLLVAGDRGMGDSHEGEFAPAPRGKRRRAR